MTQLAFVWPGAEDRLDAVNDRERIRHLERMTYICGVKRAFHAPHPFERDGHTLDCPGLISAYCGAEADHTHHRWFRPAAFYWCNGCPPLHLPEFVQSVSRQP